MVSFLICASYQELNHCLIYRLFTGAGLLQIGRLVGTTFWSGRRCTCPRLPLCRTNGRCPRKRSDDSRLRSEHGTTARVAPGNSKHTLVTDRKVPKLTE